MQVLHAGICIDPSTGEHGVGSKLLLTFTALLLLYVHVAAVTW
jgi:hypothetical protein